MSSISKFMVDWREQHEAKKYKLVQSDEQEAFLEAATSLLRHLAHTAQSAAIYTVTVKDAVSTIYIRVTQ